MDIWLPSCVQSVRKLWLNYFGNVNLSCGELALVSTNVVVFTYEFTNLLEIELANSSHDNICAIKAIHTIDSGNTNIVDIDTFFVLK